MNVASKIEVLFEFSILTKKRMAYRGIKDRSGFYRMEKKGPTAKNYRAVMWTGSLEGLHNFREAVLTYSGR